MEKHTKIVYFHEILLTFVYFIRWNDISREQRTSVILEHDSTLTDYCNYVKQIDKIEMWKNMNLP